MARKQKDIYGRIAEKEEEIKVTEERLETLKYELVELNSEKDDSEMHELFNLIKEHGLSFNDAKDILSKVS